MIKQSGQTITYDIEHLDTEFNDLSINVNTQNFAGTIVTNITNTNETSSTLEITHEVDPLDNKTFIVNISVSDTKENSVVTSEVVLTIDIPYMVRKLDNFDILFENNQIVSINANNLPYTKEFVLAYVKQGELVYWYFIDDGALNIEQVELFEHEGLNKFIPFAFENNDSLFNSISSLNNPSKILTNIYLYVLNANGDEIFRTDTYEMTLSKNEVLTGSDGYIANSLVYVNENVSNKMQRSQTNRDPEHVGETNSTGNIVGLNYPDDIDINNGVYFLSIEGGIDIATGVSNVFNMYTPLTANKNKITPTTFKVIYGS